MTLIIYNKKTGKIYTTSTEESITKDQEFATIIDEIPEGYYADSVDPDELIINYMPLPKSNNEIELEKLNRNLFNLANSSTTLTDTMALELKEYFYTWPEGVNEENKYIKGQVIKYEDKLYRIEQNVIPLENQKPNSEGMLAIYRPINLTYEGTLEEPIPWIYGMNCYKDKYYIYKQKVYKCSNDMIPCIWEPGTIGVYQWELIE